MNSQQYINTIRDEIGDNLSSLWAMKRAWNYYKLYILAKDESLSTRKGTKKQSALDRKATTYLMHFYRMFLTYGTNPTYSSLMLSRFNACRLELGYKLIPISERVDRKYHLSEVF